MVLDPKLTPEALWNIAADKEHLNEDLLSAIKYHPNSYLDLQDWATAALYTGIDHVTPPPPPPAETAPKPRRFARSAGATGKVKWRLPVFLGGGLALVLVGGLWAISMIRDDGKELSAQSSPLVQQAQSAPQSNGLEGSQSDQIVPGRELRSGRDSFECSTPGEGVTCWGWLSAENIRPRTMVPVLEGKQIDFVEVGRGFAFGITTDGAVYSWGINDKGQLGTDPVTSGTEIWEGREVGVLPSRASAAVAGEDYGCAVSEGQVWCFGNNKAGQIRGVPSEEPMGLSLIEEISGASELGSSGYATWARTTEGQTWAWGNNKFGQVNPDDSAMTLPPQLASGE